MNALLLVPLILGGAMDLDYRIEGDVVQIVRKLPFAVVVQSPGDLFFWSVPAGFTVDEQGARLQVTSAPAGSHTLTLKIVSIDWDKKKVTQADAKIEIIIGQLPNPPPDPDKPAGCESLSGVAREVCGWVALVPSRSQGKRAELAKMFLALGDGLATGRWINYSQSNLWFSDQRDKILDTQVLKDDWAKFGGRIGQAIAPLASDRSKVIAFYRDVAKGLR